MTPPFFLGGAEVSQRILAQRLVNQGHAVRCLGTYAHPVTGAWDRLPGFLNWLRSQGHEYRFDGAGTPLFYVWKDIACTMVSGPSEYEDQLARSVDGQCDLVVTSLEGAEATVSTARARGIRSVAWIHDALPVGLAAARGDPTFILCTSSFVRDQLALHWGRQGHLFYPPFVAPRQLATIPSDVRDAIVFVNPIPEKGVAVVLEIARQLPDRQFIFVEAWRSVAEELGVLPENVTLLARQNDLDKVFANARLLLVPSQLEEGFGRVVVEAGLHGIPCVASRRGGLPEAVGAGGVLLNSSPSCVTDWVDAIRHLDRPATYRWYGRAALHRASGFLRDPLPELSGMGVLR